MGRRGIVLDERGELKVKVMKDADGFITQGLVVDESDYDHVALIVASNKGDFKDYPVLGVGERYLKSVGRAAEMRADVQTQLELDGYKADVQVSDTGELVIDTRPVPIVFCGFWVAPTGEIHNSVLVAYGEISTFAGALFGVDYTYRFKRYLNANNKEEKRNE